MERKKLIFFSVGIIVVLFAVFLPGYSVLNKKKEDNEQLLKRISLLEAHNNELKAEMAKMRKDPLYIEQKAREKLGIVRKGEIIYRPNTGMSEE